MWVKFLGLGLCAAMIVGNGDIASVLNDREDAIFFASGVSNSGITQEQGVEFEKEGALAGYYIGMANELGKCFVYFSTISRFTKSTFYTRNKYTAELMIKSMCENYCIIRIGNISWGTNPNTFINYIRNKKAKGEPVEIRHEWKYMISKEQLLFITDNMPLKGKHDISVFGEMKLVKDCI